LSVLKISMSALSNRPYRARSPPADTMFSEGASLFTQLPQTQTERSEARARATTNTTWSGDHQCRLTSTPSTQSFLSTSLLDGLAAGLNPGMLQLLPNLHKGLVRSRFGMLPLRLASSSKPVTVNKRRRSGWRRSENT
jgi:hypothetical protein